MDEQIIREIIINQKEESKEMLRGVIKRQIPDLSIYIRNPNILTVMGIRRCGKSTLALCLVNNIKAAYVNFDDERLINITSDDLNLSF